MIQSFSHEREFCMKINFLFINKQELRCSCIWINLNRRINQNRTCYPVSSRGKTLHLCKFQDDSPSGTRIQIQLLASDKIKILNLNKISCLTYLRRRRTVSFECSLWVNHKIEVDLQNRLHTRLLSFFLQRKYDLPGYRFRAVHKFDCKRC